MLKQSDAVGFIKAMMKETAVHESRDHWTVIARSSPRALRLYLQFGFLREKRYPDVRINNNKHKAGLCAHGGMQTHVVNYWDT